MFSLCFPSFFPFFLFALLPAHKHAWFCPILSLPQLPAVITRGITVVVCPLLALMQDQVGRVVSPPVAAMILCLLPAVLHSHQPLSLLPSATPHLTHYTISYTLQHIKTTPCNTTPHLTPQNHTLKRHTTNLCTPPPPHHHHTTTAAVGPQPVPQSAWRCACQLPELAAKCSRSSGCQE